MGKLAQSYTESRKTKKQRDIFQTKGQAKTPGIDLNEMEINDVPDRECKVLVTEMLTEIRRTMYEQSEISSKRIYKKKTKQKPQSKRIQ